MKVRLAALITTCAAALLWLSPPSKAEDPARTCVSSKAPQSDVIAACTSLIEAEDTTEEYRHLFLTERAWAHRCNGDYERAIADVDRALELQPKNYKTWVLRSRINEANGNIEAAKADYDDAMEVDPDGKYTLWDKASFLKRHDGNEAAFKVYQELLNIDPDFQSAADKEIGHLLAHSEIERATERVEAAIEKWPDEEWVYVRAMQLHVVFMGDIEKALVAASNVSRLEPTAWNDLFYPGLIHLRLGDEEAGVEIIVQYGVQILTDSVNKLRGWDYLVRKTSQWVVVGGLEVEAGIYKGMAYGYAGRSDLAKKEFYLFLKMTGSHGRTLLPDLVRNLGIAVDSNKFAKSDTYVDEVLDEYIVALQDGSIFPVLAKETDAP